MLQQWSDKFSIGVDIVDAQHQEFFRATQRLYQEILNGSGEGAVERTLGFLRSYAIVHFTTEEALMEKHRYPDIEAHKKLHEEFLDRLDELCDDYDIYIAPNQAMAERVLDMTQTWLLDHIAGEDRRYTPYVK